MMHDFETVINGLDTCSISLDQPCPVECPYYKRCFTRGDISSKPFLPVMQDAIALIKEQQKLIAEITQRRANNGAFD